MRQQAPSSHPLETQGRASPSRHRSHPNPPRGPQVDAHFKIPRTTTTSKAGKTGRISNAPSRLSSSLSPWASQSGHAGAQGLNVAEAGSSERRPARALPNGRPRASSPVLRRAFLPVRACARRGRSPDAHPEHVQRVRHLHQDASPDHDPLVHHHRALVIYTCVDIPAPSFGRIHPGVSVQGVDVGGLSVQDASTKINEELSPSSPMRT